VTEPEPRAQLPRPADHGRVQELALAYLDADYRWELDGRWHPLAVGAPPGDEFLRAHPNARSLGLLSAWNPHSVERSEALNREADAALQAALEASDLMYHPAFSAARNRSWREPGWLVLDMPRATLDALARRFGQLGTLRWEPGGQVRLRMYAAGPRSGASLPDCIDWLGAGPPPQA
jgi:hypothetical protein